ncbi:MAG: (2Fe-2S) ferredoxin domain-containing protein [Acidimicrobiia bacterium]|nr:(2Fe-2S) ferredoxin domain-containing protein [Acidimicrobiia bacterium]
MITTKRQTLAQVMVCLGCCCGRVDKGKPAVPSDWLKAEWKRRRLLKHVHLTIAGCLGPCEIANVVTIVVPEGTLWFGGISGSRFFEELLVWASASAAAGRLAPLPESFEPHRFERYAVATSAAVLQEGSAA